MRLSFLCLVSALMVMPVSAYAATQAGLAAAASGQVGSLTKGGFELDRPYGLDSKGYGAGSGIESPMDVTDNPSLQNDKALRAFGMGRPAEGAAYGNLIAIQTTPGSSVVVNAQQYNTGDQNVVVNNLRGFGAKSYKNVETPTPPDYISENLGYQQ